MQSCLTLSPQPPRAERDALFQAGAEAEALAAIGKLASGFMCLALGLQHARDEETDGKAWADELVRLYRAAMEAYAHRHGLWAGRAPLIPSHALGA
jgi:alkanesulfonate monooxygenase SsuD/methylene tetrahydromethanopterin reductase-like flavin-dependent oxidoreductase (luciferase family)